MSLLLILGPTGVGKSSVIRLLPSIDERFEYIRPWTTRGLRPGETDKVSVTEAEMALADAHGEFLVINELFGVKYATPSRPIEVALDHRRFPMIDWPISRLAAMQDAFPGQCVRCYLSPPDLKTLEERILRRDGVDKRFVEARAEFLAFEEGAFGGAMDYCVVSREGDLLNVVKEVYENFLRFRGETE